MAKEVEQTQPLALFTAKVIEYVKENLNQIASIASVILIIAAGIFYWQYTSLKAEKDSFSSFSRALTTMSMDVKTDTEREVVSQQALELFKNVVEKYPKTKTGAASLYYSGNCSLTLKNYDEAIDYYNKFLGKSDKSFVYLRALAYEGLGYAYEGKGEFTKAIEWFEKQKNEGKDVDISVALLSIARCQELSGDNAAACKSYTDFENEYSSSSFIETAQMKINNLCTGDIKG
jgi:tetratricopeptide (TPR) repeat protein